jgi:peptidoglycan/xylan/chitin deacetylase (PgdA/CDA1 family)
MNKIAFMTIDVESMYDSELLKDRMKYDPKYSYECYLKDYIDLLNKYNIKGTLFVLESSIDKIKDILDYAIKSGHEIALHGKKHTSPLEQENEEFKRDIAEAKKNIEDELKIKIKGYRAPCFGIDDKKIEIIKDLGFEYDSSNLDFHLAKKSGRINLDSYNKESMSVASKDNFYEFSLSRVKAYSGHLPVSGGGYIRLVPWFVMKYYLKKYINHADSYVFYAHPFELKKGIVPANKELNWKEKLYLKIGRRQYLKKIEYLIKYLKKKGYSFMSMNEYGNR